MARESERTVKVNNVQHCIDTEMREQAFEERRAHPHGRTYQEYRRAWSENPAKGIVDAYPLHVDLELSSLCGLKCPMCYTITDEFKKKVNAGFMDFDLYRRLVDECAENHVYSLRLSLRGESFNHPKFIEAIRYAKDKGIREVSSLTAGHKLYRRDYCDQIVEAGLDWITVSIDGVGEVYESIRKPVTFDRITQGLKNLVDSRREHEAVKPAIKVQGIWPAVKKDLQAYLETFTELSDVIFVNPLVDYLYHDPMDERIYLPNFTCYQPFQRLVIVSSGLAVQCANDQMGEYVVGDANKQSIFEIWNGKPMQELRREQLQHKSTKCNTVCATCQVPRARTYEEIEVSERKVVIENYVGRPQEIGT